MFKIKYSFYFLIPLLNLSCSNSKQINTSSTAKLSNYNHYNNFLYIRGVDSVYIEKFQGVGIDKNIYLNFSYRSTADSVLIYIEKANNDLRFKLFNSKNISIKPANILLSSCFVDSSASNNEISFYRLNIFSYKKYGEVSKSKPYIGTNPIIRVERFNKNVNFSLKANK